MKLLFPLLAVAALVTGCASMEAPAPPSDPGPRLASLPPPPYWVGHRTFRENCMAWGWVKRPEDPWSKAQLVILREDRARAPHRSLPSIAADHDHEYKLYGSIWSKKAYDPVLNRLLEVFDLERYESLGPQPSIRRPLQPAVPSDGSWRALRNTGGPTSGGARDYEDIEAQL